MEAMLDRDILPLLISLIGKGDATDKECAANTLWIIAKTSIGKGKDQWKPANAMEELTRLSKSGNQAIQDAAKRVLLELKETRTTRGTDLYNSCWSTRGYSLGDLIIHRVSSFITIN